MVYQEDVIKVAHYFAGLSLGEADVLRRGMSGKYRSREEFQQVKEKFFKNCTQQKGYTGELTAEIWRQTESFAGYAFAKGHSASYAVESYQSLFLKAYYPLEYMVATINNGGGFYTREHYIHEARMKGAHVEGPCIQESADLTRIDGTVIHLGFHLVKGLDQAVIDRIIEQRGPASSRLRSMSVQNGYSGQFESLEDLLDRVPMGMEQLNILIRIGALRNLGCNGNENVNSNGNVNGNGVTDDSLAHQPMESAEGSKKKHLLWQAYWILEKKQKRHDEQMRLFRPPHKDYTLPHLDHQVVEDAFDEMEYLGFPLCHPFDLLREPVDDHIRLSNLHEYVGQTVTVYGYLVTAKNTQTKLGDRMNFGNFVDRDGAFLDTVHFPDVAARYPFRGKGVYAVTGKVVEEWEFQTIEVERMERLPYVDDPRYVEETADPSPSDSGSLRPQVPKHEMDKDRNRIRTEIRRKENHRSGVPPASPLQRGVRKVVSQQRGVSESAHGRSNPQSGEDMAHTPRSPLERGGAHEPADENTEHHG
jgi:DNA polymerase-3 subunit alpha